MNYCIGVDLGGANIAVGLVDLSERKIVRRQSCKTNAPRSCEAISADIVRLIEDVCSKAGVSRSELGWIGVATPGIVKDGVVLSASNLGWENVDFPAVMRNLTSLPVFVANDANAVAYAEAIWGVGEDASSLMAITLGTGVGGGIVIDGKIWEGINGFAAEVGHIIIDADGRQCPCGKRGCLEAYCSAPAVVRDARRVMKLYPDSALWKMCEGDASRMNAVIPFRAAERGDRAAREVVHSFVKHLAIGVSNLINLFQPEVICIGGGISGEGEKLLSPLRERVEKISYGIDGQRTLVTAAKYMNNAGIIGSALLGMPKERMQMEKEIRQVVKQFSVKGDFVSATPYGNGHINVTKYVLCKDGDKSYEYILQRINKNVFKNPPALMENYTAVTEFLRGIITEQDGDPDRETLNVVKTLDGKNYYLDEDGEYWRLVLFVKDSLSYDKVERPEQFYLSAVSFGNFQYLLKNYPADTLHETIVNFHNTPERYNQLMAAVEADKCGRLAEVMAEVEFCKARREFTETLERAQGGS